MFLCRRTEQAEETEEQSTAVWSSSCCSLDQRGNKRGLPLPIAALKVFDGQSAAGVPLSPPCGGQAARVTCPHWTGAKKV